MIEYLGPTVVGPFFCLDFTRRNKKKNHGWFCSHSWLFVIGRDGHKHDRQIRT